MDYGRLSLADALAVDYVVGTLRGAARRRFEALLPAHPGLRATTREWQERLMPLTAAIEPVQPSGDVWRRISDRIAAGSSAVASTPRHAWQRLSFWRTCAGLAGIAAIGFAALLANPGPQAPPVVVVLAATGAAGGGAAVPAIVASISGDRATLVTRSIVPVSARSDHSLELWAIPTQGAPRSLGLLPAGSGSVALRGKVLAGADTLAVSVEPAGGSPSGAPTGPVVYAGKFSL